MKPSAVSAKAPGKRGPKLTQINWTEFDKLCAMQCPLSEIASWFECCEDTIETAVKREQGMSFSEYFAQKRGKGKISLRRKQMELALAGDKVMLIWLGKQYLDQVDKQDLRHSGDIGNWSELAAKAAQLEKDSQ